MKEPRAGIVGGEPNRGTVSVLGADADDITADGVIPVVTVAAGTTHDRERMLQLTMSVVDSYTRHKGLTPWRWTGCWRYSHEIMCSKWNELGSPDHREHLRG